MARYQNNRNTSTARNADMYVGVYDSREAAEAGDREGLLTVQNFVDGDFPIMEFLDKDTWEDGEIVEHTFVVRVHKRKPEKEAPKRAWSAKSAPSAEAAEAGESAADLPY